MMEITVHLWWLPALLTIGVWAWALLSPPGHSTGDYSFGPQIVALARGVAAIVGTLAFWLVYFALGFWGLLP